MATEMVHFENQSGETLQGAIELPPKSLFRGMALFAHCFTCSKQSRAAVFISRYLANHGIGVLRFDFSGLGQSQGDFGDGNFSSNVADLVSAADYLKHAYQGPHLLVGHSWGGAAVLAAAAQIPQAVGVVTIGAPASPDHVLRLLSEKKPEIEENGVAEVKVGDRSFHFTAPFIQDLRQVNLRGCIANLHKALLIFHAPRDQVVGIEHAAEIFGAAKHPKSFLSLDDADHLLSRVSDLRYVASNIATWADRYLPDPIKPEGGDNRVWVKTEAGEGFETTARVRDHFLLADEPPKSGGADLGPNPYDFLSIALGTCSTMTLKMYAQKKGWPVESVRVVVDHKKVHRGDCEDCGASGSMVDVFERELKLEGTLSEEQRQRLMEIANRCPVHRTLNSSVEVHTVWAEDSGP